MSRLAGHYCWVESQLFEILGAWLHECSDPDLVVLLGERCTRHGEHAQAWAQRIAAIPTIDAASFIAPSGADAVSMARLRALDGDVSSRVAVLEDEVLPGLVSTYRAHRALVDPLVDGPTARLLDAVIAADAATLSH